MEDGGFLAYFIAGGIMGGVAVIIAYLRHHFKKAKNIISNKFKEYKIDRDLKEELKKFISKEDERKSFEKASLELKTSRDEGLWAQLYVKCKGNDNKTELEYLQNRASEILETIALENKKNHEKKKEQDEIRKKIQNKKDFFTLLKIILVGVAIFIFGKLFGLF